MKNPENIKKFQNRLKNNNQNLNVLKQNIVLILKRDAFTTKIDKKNKRSNEDESSAQEATRLFNVSSGLQNLTRNKNSKGIDPKILEKIREMVPFGIGGKKRNKFIQRVRGSQNTRGIVKELAERKKLLETVLNQKIKAQIMNSNVSINKIRELVKPAVILGGRAAEPETNSKPVKPAVSKFKKAVEVVIQEKKNEKVNNTMKQVRKVTKKLKNIETTKKFLAAATNEQRRVIARKEAAKETRGVRKKENTVGNLFSGLPPIGKPKPTKKQLENVKKMQEKSEKVVEKNATIQALLAEYSRSKSQNILIKLKKLGYNKRVQPKISNAGGQGGKAMRKKESSNIIKKREEKKKEKKIIFK